MLANMGNSLHLGIYVSLPTEKAYSHLSHLAGTFHSMTWWLEALSKDPLVTAPLWLSWIYNKDSRGESYVGERALQGWLPERQQIGALLAFSSSSSIWHIQKAFKLVWCTRNTNFQVATWAHREHGLHYTSHFLLWNEKQWYPVEYKQGNWGRQYDVGIRTRYRVSVNLNSNLGCFVLCKSC